MFRNPEAKKPTLPSTLIIQMMLDGPCSLSSFPSSSKAANNAAVGSLPNHGPSLTLMTHLVYDEMSMVDWVAWRGTKPGMGYSRWMLSAKSWRKWHKSGTLIIGKVLTNARGMCNSRFRNHRPRPVNGIQYSDLGQGEYVRLVISPGASGVGLVILKGAKAKLVFRRRGELCVADEGTVRAKVADIRRGLHIIISTYAISDSRLTSRNRQFSLEVIYAI